MTVKVCLRDFQKNSKKQELVFLQYNSLEWRERVAVGNPFSPQICMKNIHTYLLLKDSCVLTNKIADFQLSKIPLHPPSESRNQC
jgi:hypothetical protein